MDTRLGLGSNSNRTLTLRLLEGPAIQVWWPSFEAALNETRKLIVDSWTLDLILSAVVSDRMQMWVTFSDDTPRVMILTQFYRTGTTAVFQIFWAYGESLAESFPLLSDAFDKFAKYHGAEKIEIQGRKGFERWLKPFGFEVDYVTYSRRVKAPTEN